jgi:predicted dehydrogenase
MSYRAAVIGCGRIGSELANDPKANGVVSHAQAYAACPSTELVAICDTDPQRLNQCGDLWGVEAQYSDAATMLAKAKPEIISICTPDNTHSELTQAAILAPNTKAIFAEKPLSLEVNDASEIVRIAIKQNVVLAVNYSRRFADSHIRLRDFIDDGGIGDLQTIGGFYTKGIKHNGTHWFDLARFFCGDVESVWAQPRADRLEADPTLDAVLGFQCGASGHLQGCDETSFSLFEMDVLGTTGRIKITDYGQTVQSFKVDDSPFYSGYQTLVPNGNFLGGFEDVMLKAVENVVDCLENGKQPLCSGSDAVEALRIAAAACKSAQTGRSVILGATAID